MKNTALLVALIAMTGFTSAIAQDYAREKRWADEILPAVVVGEAVQIRATSGRDFLALYTDVKGPRPAVVLVHGVGVHPDHGVIGILRDKLATLGYTTLSIQMPVQSKEAQLDDYYPKVFPDAADRMARAAEWLRARGHAEVVLLTHSMGAWMANEYLDRAHGSTPYKAWIVMGLTGSYSWTMRGYAFPVLDIYGEQDLAPTLGAAGRRKLALKSSNGSRQVMVAGADHHYAGRENALAAEVDAFLRERKLP
jgi:pimeloyl-ACP methyl ester carboxylesterase